MLELTGLSKGELLELTRSRDIFNHNGKVTFDIFSLVELKDYIVDIVELEVVIKEIKRLNNLIKDEILSKLIIESNSKKEISKIFAIKDVHTKQIFVGFSKRIDERIKEIFSMGIGFEQTELIYVSPFISNAVLLKRQITANFKALSSLRQSWLDVSEEEFLMFVKEEIEPKMILELAMINLLGGEKMRNYKKLRLLKTSKKGKMEGITQYIDEFGVKYFDLKEICIKHLNMNLAEILYFKKKLSYIEEFSDKLLLLEIMTELESI